MNELRLIIKNNNYSEFGDFLLKTNLKKILLVCGCLFDNLQVGMFLKNFENENNISFVKFTDFQPNPQYAAVVKGIESYKTNGCEAILAIGGGSAIDVAKCIKLFCNLDSKEKYLKQEIVPNQIPFFAIPTTSGTGSEATRFAVIYYKGEKQSVSDISCIPSMVVFDSSTLNTLPVYQKKATMLDAMCHAIESFWSVNSTEESRKYSDVAIKKILENIDSYFANETIGNINMLEAANIAGKAINITQTTAGHAMCYKLTSLYGLSHGHAAALCVSKLWPYMILNTNKCIDSRGEKHLKNAFKELAYAFGCEKSIQAVERFNNIISDFDFDIPHALEEDIEILKKSVNPVRLKNNPIELDDNTIERLYREILMDKEKI